MLLGYQIIFMLLLPLAHSANVLVICGLPGSHLFLSIEVAEKLVEFGHNVTILTSYEDSRVNNMRNRKFHFIAFAEDNGTSEDILKLFSYSFEDSLSSPSKDMEVNLYIGSERIRQGIDKQLFDIQVSYFKGKKFAKLLEDGKFDLVVIEETASLAAPLGLVNMDFPVMYITLISESTRIRHRQGWPSFLNSEQHPMNEILGDEPPTFVQRWETVVRYGRLYMWMFPKAINIFKEEAIWAGMSVLSLFGQFDIVFVLEHPAFSFPYQTPPNTFYLGPFHLEGRTLNPLPDIYQEFLANCPYQHIALMSFSSFLPDITVFPKTADIVKTIGDMKLCVIIKTNVDIVSKNNLPPNQILQQAWLPQKDLLGSGKIDFVISHCGHNGRLESIFYGVPLLCIPLFGDHYHNARLVDRNKFGVYVTKEDLSEDTFRGAVDTVLGNKELFVANMKNAVEIARNDPGAGTNVLKFYTDLLIKNRNADFLINKIILKQSFTEIMNLDIAMLALLVLVGLAVGVIICVCKVLKLCCRTFSKPKTE